MTETSMATTKRNTARDPGQQHPALKTIALKTMALKTIALKTILAMLVLLAASSCALGPDFSVPEAPDVQGYTTEALPDQTASADVPMGDAQVFVRDQDIPAQWWELFGSEALNQLIVMALEANPDLQEAEAALVRAQENLYANRGSLYPAIDGNLGVDKQRFSYASFGQPEIPPTTFTLYNASVDVAYDVDIFGKTSRRLESLAARVEGERFKREAVYIALTANVVSYAVQAASLQAQIEQTEAIVKGEQRRLAMLQKDLEIGAVAQSTVLTQQINLAELLITLPELKKQLAVVRNQLAVLLGQVPGAAKIESIALSDLHLPQEIPVSLPSDLVQQRPDIRISQALLHAASAEVGVATANMFPQFTIAGSYGGLAFDFSDVFSSDSLVWNIGAGLTQPLFRAGQLKHAKKSAVAGFEQAAAQYRSTVLKAFQNVADSLHALQYDAEKLAAQSSAESAASENLKMAEQRLEIGAISDMALLDAQRSHHHSKIALIQSQAIRLTDTAALFQALGGGWWARVDKTQ